MTGPTPQEQEFIDCSVSMQLGNLVADQVSDTPAARTEALEASSGSAVHWNSTSKLPEPTNDWSLAEGSDLKDLPVGLRHRGADVANSKAARALAEILSFGPTADVIVDMQDRRVRAVSPEGAAGYPVFCFNRRTGSSGRILWPLPGYHDLGSDGFLGGLNPRAVAWKDKVGKVVWRGASTGRMRHPRKPGSEGKRLRPLLRDFRTGKIDENQLQAALRMLPRYGMVDRFFDHDLFDVGFVDGAGLRVREVPLHSRLAKQPMSRQEMQQFKFVAVLRGMDVGSGFYWAMNSGSLALVMETAFETFASAHFRPWTHYVPFRDDLSDIEDRLSWCLANDDECREIAQRAAELCRLISSKHLRGRILRGVVDGFDAVVAQSRRK